MGGQGDWLPTGRLDNAATARLRLRRPGADDASLVHERVVADSRTWELDPTLRGGSPQDTAQGLRWHADRWRADGLGAWVVREHHDDDPIGLGGCSILRSGLAWNLAFRIWPERWGRGFGLELAAAAVAAAQQVRPDLPVTAVALHSNTPSLLVLERAGLHEVGRAPDPHAHEPTLKLVLWADRTLPPAEALTLLH